MSADTADTITCANCGANNDPQNATCSQCGKALAKSDYEDLNRQFEQQNEAGLEEARKEVESTERRG